MTWHKKISGLWFVVFFALIGAFQDVYLGARFQWEDPALLSWMMAIVTAVFYLALNASGFSSLLAICRKNWRTVLLLNLSTASSWLGFFLALKYLEPAIVGTLTFGLIPLFSILVYPYLRKERSLTDREKISSAGIGVIVLALAFTALSGKSGLGEMSSWSVLKGFGWGIVAALGSTGNNMFAKQCYDRGFVPKQLMASRFYGQIFFSPLLVANFDVVSEINWLMALEIIGLAFYIYVIPLFVLHLGVERCEPITASLVLSTSPLLVLLLQRFDNRITFSYYTATLIGLSFLLTVWGTLREKKRLT